MVLINKSLKNRIFYTAEGNLKFNIHGIADRQLSKHYEYGLYLEDPDGLTCDNAIFTDDEFSALIKHIKTLPDGEWQAKVAEHGKTLVKGE